MERNELIHLINRYITTNQLIKLGDRIIVGFSGGADSVALISILSSLGICEVIIAHCNFHLRGDESMRDEQFVRDFANKYSLEAHFIDFNVEEYCAKNGVSIEMACRDLRYNYFAQLAKQINANAIAVAHHSDDNAETLMLNLLRGTGLAGLCGMQPRNGSIIRPLLSISRNDIEQYLSEVGLNYVTDSSNNSNDYKRNVLRNLIIPQLREHFPAADNAISTTIHNCNGAYAIYRQAIDDELTKAVTINADGTQQINSHILFNSASPSTLLHEAIKSYGFNTTQVLQIIESVISNNIGASYISSTHQLFVARGNIEISEITPKKPTKQLILSDIDAMLTNGFKVTIIEPNEYGKFTMQSDRNIAYFDITILDAEIRLRGWEVGDRIKPFGMRGSKKVSDLFTDMKYSSIDKQRANLLIADGEIVWVVGARRSIHYPITDNTLLAVSIELIKN
ncbi:MAG: tRNA lysidine(34) synthetase TilS [Bacteroidales bacterium]